MDEDLTGRFKLRGAMANIVSFEIAFGSDVEIEKKEKRTSQYMSIYERDTLITIRCTQLGMGMEPLIDLDELPDEERYNIICIATREVDARLVNLIVRRKFVDGSFEDWHVKDMVLPRT